MTIVLAVIGALTLISPAMAQAMSGVSPALERPRGLHRLGVRVMRGAWNVTCDGRWPSRSMAKWR